LNFHREKRKLRNSTMPMFMYEVLRGTEPYERFEVEQAHDAPPLTKHPITQDPVRKIISAATISLNHSDQKEKSVLSDQNLSRHGFSKYERAASDGTYHRTAGKDGPPVVES